MKKHDFSNHGPGGDEMSYIDIARSLITPTWRSRQESSPIHGLPSPPHTSSQALKQERQVTSAQLAETTQALQGQAAALSQNQSDRAAMLRAQLMARRQGTPDQKTSREGQGVTVASDASRSRSDVTVADIDALINAEGKSRNNGDDRENARMVSLRSSTHDATGEEVISHILKQQAPRVDVGKQAIRHIESSDDKRGSQTSKSDTPKNSSTTTKHPEAIENEKDTKAAASVERIVPIEKSINTTTFNTPDENANRPYDSEFVKREIGIASASLDGFDYHGLPIELQQWLAFTNWFNEDYRGKALANYNKKLLLQQQLRELDQNEIDLRSTLSFSAPTAQIHPPKSITAEKQSTQPIQAAPKLTRPSSTSQQAETPKRTREEEDGTEQDAEPRKAMRTENKSQISDSRAPQDIQVGRERLRRLTPPPPAPPQSSNRIYPSGYESYKPGAAMDKDRSRDREREREREREHHTDYASRTYDSRNYPSWADERSLHRERERDRERDRGFDRGPPPPVEPPARIKYEDDDYARTRGPYRGYPIVPCRFYREGKCTKGKNCTFLHE